MTEKAYQIAVLRIIPRWDWFSNNDCFEVQFKNHNADLIYHQNINLMSHLNQDCPCPNTKKQYMMRNDFSAFVNNFYVWKLIPTISIGMSDDCISNGHNSNKIKKQVKSSKDHDTFSVLREQRSDFGVHSQQGLKNCHP